MKKGFTLLEVIIAVSVVLVGVVAAVVLITRTVSQTTLSASRLIASYLTQEGIEIVRNIRDSNWLEQAAWDEGLTGCFAGCEADYTATTQQDPVDPYIKLYGATGRFLCLDANGFYWYIADPCPSGTATKFRREITIAPGIDILTVTVETTWAEKGKNYSHKAQEVLYNWK